MRIGLNATCFDDRASGAKQRFLGIYGALISAHPEIDFVIYEPADCRVAQWFEGAANVFACPTPVPSKGQLRKAVAGAMFWRHRLRADRLDLFETFNLPMVVAPDCPTLLTIHDIRYVQEDVAPIKRLANSIVLRRALAGAARVVAVSETIRSEILHFCPGSQVTTVYNGVDPARFDDPGAAAIAAVRALFDLPAHFALSVGHIEPRKNYGTAVAAFAELARRGSELSLVIVGRDSGECAQIQLEIARQGVVDRVRILGDVNDAALQCLYQTCELVLLPSLYEGFGLALLEAMAASRPLVLSDIAVFRELTEGQGCYFTPTDGIACAGRIEALRSDPGLSAALVAYGDRRVADFAFPTLAEEVYALYLKLASPGVLAL